MKTLDEVLKGFECNTIDGRDVNRLVEFVPEDRLSEIGVELKDKYKGKHVAKKWTEENILAQLKKDVEFGFEKALDQRGISSSLMYNVVRMWNDILENGVNEEVGEKYAMYGLPLFKATALKYGWDNPIGNDTGEEQKYEEDDCEGYDVE